jgi:hypothetical protein
VSETRSQSSHPLKEELEETEREVARGASARTPAFVLGGVTLVVGITVAVVVGLAFLAWFLAR